MKYEDISPAMRRYMGAFMGFRGLGFLSDDLYLMTARSAKNGGILSAFCVLRTADSPEFSVECGPLETEEETFVTEYKRVCVALNRKEISETDADRIWFESEPYQDPEGFVRALIGKGVRIPKAAN